MTIQRLTFEDKGQGVLWWEIDDQTGRIVGCGPREAHTWASGRCSVDMNTVVVGECPIFHGPATEPGGRFLNYRIASITPAQTGGVASMTELTHLIEVVNAKLAGVAPLVPADHEDWQRWRSDGDRVIQELRDELGARIRTVRDPATMRMGGITTSATGGWASLLTNWVHAARKKLVAPAATGERVDHAK